MARIETGAEHAAREEALLTALREECPDLDFHHAPGLWIAAPAGTPLRFALSLTALAIKLRDERPTP